RHESRREVEKDKRLEEIRKADLRHRSRPFGERNGDRGVGDESPQQVARPQIGGQLFRVASLLQNQREDQADEEQIRSRGGQRRYPGRQVQEPAADEDEIERES